MSLFKAREWWSTVVGDKEIFDLGCLCVADLLNCGSDQVIVGSYHKRLSIFQPKLDTVNGYKAEDVLIETQLSDPVLQVEAGRFVSGSSALHLAVLHPRKLAVYHLTDKDGVTSHGVQYQFRSVYEHKLQRTAFNLCFGSFGGVRDRDFICIQSMDGTISIFEQETFSFSRFLPGALLPGPIRYVRSTDSFVTVASSCQVDCYKFQKLAHASDEKQESQSINKGQRVTSDWSFLINELGMDIVVTRFGNSPVTIFVLGERNLYALSEAGQLVYMKKLDYNPSCFLPYFPGKNDNIHCLIGTHNQTMLVYENVSVKWAARLSFVPVQIKVANIQGLQGTVVALDDDGHLCCFYLGTDPSFISHSSSYMRELDYNSAEAEMKQLQKIIKEKQKLAAPTVPMGPSFVSDDDLRITVSLAPSVDKVSAAVEAEIKDDMPIPSITASIQLQAKCALSNVNLTCYVSSPLVCSEPTTTIPSVVPGQPVETRVSFYMKYAALPADLRLTVITTYYTSNGAPRVVQQRARLPLSLVIRPCQPVKNAVYKLTIDTNKSTVNLGEMFSDIWGANSESASSAVGFKFYGLEPVITVLAAKNSQRYRVQCDNFGFMGHITNELLTRLASHFKMGASSDFNLFYESPLPLQEYFEIIDKHFECRQQNELLVKTLEENAAQFRAIQKRLLIMFKDKTPSSLKNLDSLLDYTYNQIISVTDAIESNRDQQSMLSGELSCSTNTLNALIRLKYNLSSEDFKVLESALSPIVNDSSTQGWEETVDVSVTHLLRTTLSKNAKDAALNPTPLSSLKDVQNVKKHLAMMCDRLSKGAKLTDGTTATARQPKLPKSREDSTDQQAVVTDYRSLLATKPLQKTEPPVLNKIPYNLAGGDSVPGDDWSAGVENGGSVGGETIYRKKKTATKASDNVPDLDSIGRNDTDQDSGSTMKFNGNELVYGID